MQIPIVQTLVKSAIVDVQSLFSESQSEVQFNREYKMKLSRHFWKVSLKL